jgi:hypothetical protein
MRVLLFGALASTGWAALAAGSTTADVSDAGTPAPAAGNLSFTPMLGLPASQVGLIGASPNETPGEVWAQGQLGDVPATAGGLALADQQALLRYTDAQGDWQLVPLEDSNGDPIPFQWNASEATSNGGLVLIGEPAGSTGASAQTLVMRDPGGAFDLAPPPTASGTGAVLDPGEQLYATSGGSDPLIAAFDGGDGSTGAFVLPHADGSPASPGVLLYTDGSWTREQVCVSYTPGSDGTPGSCSAPGGYSPLAVAAASAQDAWLLASTSTQPLELFRRTQESDGTTEWVAEQPASFLLNPADSGPTGETVTAPSGGPVLTATTQGVWVDAHLSGGTAGSATVLVSADASADVLGTWCYPQSACPSGAGDLGAALPSSYASTAWPGASAGDPGQRVITGVGSDGAMLVLSGGQFQYTPGAGAGGGGGAAGPGGEALASGGGTGNFEGGAAFSSPDDGWLAGTSADGGAPQVVQVSDSAASAELASWPVPFGSPLLAVAPQPGTAPGDSAAQALAVGVGGEVAWYKPGDGWEPDYLYSGSGARETPTLRGVAWPEAGRAYAVGDDGAMWLWQSTTDLWEPDPAEQPELNANFNAIAFQPGDPDLGYAVGDQGTLLQYGKSWTQVPLPASVKDANFTSVAFAGSEAIVGYEQPIPNGSGYLTGGLLVNDGSGWQIDQGAQQLLESEQPLAGGNGVSYRDDAIFKVAGLPNGGAVAAGPGVVIERDSLTGAWHFASQPLPEAANVAALSAFENGAGQTQALISIDPQISPDTSLLWQGIDNPPTNPALGSAPVHLAPDPLPAAGYLLRQTSSGWQDLERDDYPASTELLPVQPDAVLALDVSQDGGSGWALGGDTGTFTEVDASVQTAGVMRLGSGPAPPQSTSAPISLPAGEATFALGGDASCFEACADLANVGIGADVWTTTALQRASQIQGLRAFLWTGGRLATSSGLSSDEMTRELDRYGQLLHSASAGMPVYAAISAGEVNANSGSAAFASALGSAAPVGRSLPGTPPPPDGTAAYAFQSGGGTGTIDVIVLDYSASTLVPGGSEGSGGCPQTDSAANQLDWLCAELHAAKAAGDPALVMGSDSVAGGAADATAVDRVLVTAGASAYLFDSPSENVSQTISYDGQSIPAFGSGTLGYDQNAEIGTGVNLSANGFLLVSVDAGQRNPVTNVAPVSATLIPNIGSLSIDATDGTLLRRSQVALFDGLARIPLAGLQEAVNPEVGVTGATPASYIPIPEACTGAACSEFIAPAYTFTSSKPDIGDFVEQSPDSTNPRAVYIGANGSPVADSHSGLFCAYNAGTTTVTNSSGGLSYSEPVTVQVGSVEQPCGTVPLTNPPVLAPVPAPVPLGNAPRHLAVHSHRSLSIPHAPRVAHASPPVHKPAPAKAPARAPALIPQPSPTLVPVRPIVPPVSPVSARPTPPSGTAEVQAQAPVSQPVGVAEYEREDEPATQVVHHMVAFEPDQPSHIPAWPLALVPLAALGLASVRKTWTRPERQLAQAVTHRHSECQRDEYRRDP